MHFPMLVIQSIVVYLKLGSCLQSPVVCACVVDAEEEEEEETGRTGVVKKMPIPT